MAPKPKATLYVVVTEKHGRIQVYGPSRKGTALRFKEAWYAKFGRWREARVVKLTSMETINDMEGRVGR